MSKPKPTMRIERHGESLRILGPMTASSIAHLRPETLALDGIEQIDLNAVPMVDSVGIALIADLVGRGQPRPRVEGKPQGLAELCQAYRIAPDFSNFP